MKTEPLEPFRLAALETAIGELGKTDSIPYAAAALRLTEEQARQQGAERLSWCGLFCVWCYQRAGSAASWVIGKGITPRLLWVSEPTPGDVGYIDQPFQHYALVAARFGRQIISVDGNSPGGVVAMRTRDVGEFSGFLSADSLRP